MRDSIPKIPVGIVIRKSQGGDDSLKSMLDELRRFLFSGYIKIDVETDEGQILGIVLLNTGITTACYREATKKKRKRKSKSSGKEALGSLLEDTVFEDAVLEIHGKVDIYKLEETFKDAIVSEKDLAEVGLDFENKTVSQPSGDDSRVALSWGLDDRNTRFEKDLETLHEDGYEVDRIREMLEESPEMLKNFSKRVGETKALMRMLTSLEAGGRESEKDEILQRVLAFEDPKTLKKLVFDFQKRLREDQLTLRLEDQLSKETENKDREKQVQEVYGLIMKHTQTVEDENSEGIEEREPVVTGLRNEMTFKNFVVGPSNEFAVAASKMVARDFVTGTFEQCEADLEDFYKQAHANAIKRDP